MKNFFRRIKMRKNILVSLSILAFAIVFALSPTIASAKDPKFILSNVKQDNKSLKLAKPDKTTGVVTKDLEGTVDQRPTFIIIFSKLIKGTTTATLTEHFKATDAGDLREITMTAQVVIKTDTKGRKIESLTIVDNLVNYTGTNSLGTTVSGFAPTDAAAITGSKKKITVNTELLITAALEEKIGKIGKQAGTYDYDWSIADMPIKFKNRTFNTLQGVLTVQ